MRLDSWLCARCISGPSFPEVLGTPLSNVLPFSNIHFPGIHFAIVTPEATFALGPWVPRASLLPAHWAWLQKGLPGERLGHWKRPFAAPPHPVELGLEHPELTDSPRTEQHPGTHLCAEASYTPLSPATDSSDTAADTQATFRPHPGATLAAVSGRGRRKRKMSSSEILTHFPDGPSELQYL